LCVTVITLLLSQASFSNSQVLLYVFPLLPHMKLMEGEQDLAHAHSAEPLDTTHLACGGHALRAQGVVGPSGRQKDNRERKRNRYSRKAAVDLCKPYFKNKKTQKSPFIAIGKLRKKIKLSIFIPHVPL